MFERNTFSTLYDLPLSTAPVNLAKAAVAIVDARSARVQRFCRTALGRRRVYPRVAPRKTLTSFHAVHRRFPRVGLHTGARRSGERLIRFLALLEFPQSRNQEAEASMSIGGGRIKGLDLASAPLPCARLRTHTHDGDCSPRHAPGAASKGAEEVGR